ncbi:hypothetical protein Q9Q99_00690 [Curtobacterium flaccumfaciens]|nr:hypothetical protein Q9Q99_00690 [Curtobacterium flaccumfaciens]
MTGFRLARSTQVRDRPRRGPGPREARVGLGQGLRQVRHVRTAGQLAAEQVPWERPRAEREGPRRTDAEPPGQQRDGPVRRDGGDHGARRVGPVDDGLRPGLEARLAPVGQVLFQRDRLGIALPGLEEGLGRLRQGAEPADEARLDEFAARGGAEERRVPPASGEAPQGADRVRAEPGAVERRCQGGGRQVFEVTLGADRDRLGGADALEDCEHQVVGLEQPGERAFDRQVDAVPTGDEEQVGAGDVAVFVGPDVLHEPSRGTCGRPGVAADEQQPLDGAGQPCEADRCSRRRSRGRWDGIGR